MELRVQADSLVEFIRQEETGGRETICPLCGLETKVAKGVKWHSRVHLIQTVERPKKCEDCGFYFSDEELEDHKSSQLCKLATTVVEDIRKFIEEEKLPEAAETCWNELRKKLDEVCQSKESDVEVDECDFCGESAKSYSQHLTYHALRFERKSKRQIRCPVCTIWVGNTSLQEHTKRCHAETPIPSIGNEKRRRKSRSRKQMEARGALMGVEEQKKESDQPSGLEQEPELVEPPQEKKEEKIETPSRRGHRYMFSAEQKDRMEKFFNENPRASREILRPFADKIGAPQLSVCFWFQNRRQKEREEIMKLKKRDKKFLEDEDEDETMFEVDGEEPARKRRKLEDEPLLEEKSILAVSFSDKEDAILNSFYLEDPNPEDRSFKRIGERIGRLPWAVRLWYSKKKQRERDVMESRNVMETDNELQVSVDEMEPQQYLIPEHEELRVEEFISDFAESRNEAQEENLTDPETIVPVSDESVENQVAEIPEEINRFLGYLHMINPRPSLYALDKVARRTRISADVLRKWFELKNRAMPGQK